MKRWLAVRLVALGAGLCLLYALVPADVQPADGGELALVARDLGVAHPPGYPLYTMVAHVGVRLLDTPAGLRAAEAAKALSVRLTGPFGWPDGMQGGLADLRGGNVGGPPAFAVNALSALLALATLVAVYRLTRRLTASACAGVLAAVALGASPTFLAQSAVANIRMPTALFAVLLFWSAAMLVADQGEASGGGSQEAPPAPGPRLGVRWPVVGFVLLAGLAAGHHPSLVPPVACCALAMAWQAYRPDRYQSVESPAPARASTARTAIASVAALVVAAAPIAYLPIRDRAGGVLAPGTLSSVRGLYEHVTAYGFRGDMLAFVSRGDLLDRSAVVGNILQIQLGLPLLLLAALGLVWLWRRRAAMAAALGAGLACLVFLAVTYRAPQTMEYLLPAYVILAVLAGAGAHAAGRLLEAGLNRALSGGPASLATASVPVLGALLLGLARHGLPAAVVAALPRPQPVLAALACRTSGQVLAGWHHVTPLWFEVEGDLRPPGSWPQVIYVHPEGAQPIGETWRRQMEKAAASGGPTVLTQRSREMGGTDALLWPLHGTPFFVASPADAEPCGPSGGGSSSAAGATLGAVVEIDRAELVTPSWGPPELYVDAHATATVTGTVALFAQLVDPASGTVWAQADQSVGADRWSDPRGVGRRLYLWTFRGTPPASLHVVLGAYRQSESGAVRLDVRPGPAAPPSAALTQAAARGLLLLGTLPVSQAAGAPGARSGAVPFGHALELLGAAVSRQGTELVVDLTWLAESGAAASDYTVSVQALGQGWSAQHDGTPAQGMIPTLKWLPGMVIHDRHRLALPAAAPAEGPVTVTVGVYDAFSLEPLGVTDRELVAAGQGQAAVVYSQ